MIRSLIKLALFLVAAILVYNYFFGDSEEKAQSREVFKKTGDALGSAWNLLKSEKEKFDAGKYDKVMEQLGGAYKALRERAQYVDEKVLRRLNELEQRKAALEAELSAIESGDSTLQAAPPPGKKGLKSSADSAVSAKQAEQDRRKESLRRELDALIRDSDALLKEAQQ